MSGQKFGQTTIPGKNIKDINFDIINNVITFKLIRFSNFDLINNIQHIAYLGNSFL